MKRNTLLGSGVFSLRLPSIILTLSLAAACSQTYDIGQKLKVDESSDGNSRRDDEKNRASLICHSDSFVQPQEPDISKLDFLFVIDTSGSMNSEKVRLAEDMKAFVNAFDVNVDLRIGILLAHSPNSPQSGKLFTYNGGRSQNGPFEALNPRDYSDTDLEFLLKDWLLNTPGDFSSDGGELGLYSLWSLSSNTNVSLAKSQGFFRDDANLVVHFVADENAVCAEYPTGVTPVPDTESAPDGSNRNREEWAKDEFCTQEGRAITPAWIQQRLRSIYQDRSILISGLLYNDINKVPAGGENEYGWGYMDYILGTGGVSVDMSGDDYEEGLAFLGNYASRRLNLTTEFPLEKLIGQVESNEIRVKVDGEVSEFTFNPGTKSVFLDNPGGYDSTIEIDYCELE